MYIYDAAIIGGGPSGLMAAIRSSMLKKDTVLLEKNNSLGKKLLLTGKGRCNLTNAKDIEIFVEKFGRVGKFLRTAFYTFSNNDLIDFFKSRGLSVKEERQERVFPVTDKAVSVLNILERALSQNRVKIFYNMRVVSIKKENNFFILTMENKKEIYAKKVILSTGGKSYKKTGSAGDGFFIVEKFGHTIIPLTSALVPLKTKENWVKKIQGLSLKNIRIIFKDNNKKIESSIGEIVFTHFGISGPLVLDNSGKIVSLLDNRKEIPLLIDLKPGLTEEVIEKRLLRDFEVMKNKDIKNIMKEYLPSKLISVFLEIGGINPDKKINQITKKERYHIIKLFKGLPVTIIGALSIEDAMVTNGGVSTKEINPRTLESKIVRGLYFAGEIIDGCAPSGGYNLQQAFSTGYLAGETF